MAKTWPQNFGPRAAFPAPVTYPPTNRARHFPLGAQNAIIPRCQKPPRPYVVSLDQVRIVREPNGVFLDYADPNVGGVHFGLGDEDNNLSDQEIIDRYNDSLRARQDLADAYEHVTIELPPGAPQLQYSPNADQWVPRGGVVKAVISDGGPDFEATFWVDDREMTLAEFGRMMLTYNGWGVRITFVPDDEIHHEPVVEVKEPE